MALIIPNFPNPHDPGHPIANAYAWLAGLALDLAHDQGSIVFNIHPNEESWQAQPIGQVTIALGQKVFVTGTTLFPSLSELMADPEFQEAYEVIGRKLYGAALGSPQFAGAIPS